MSSTSINKPSQTNNLPHWQLESIFPNIDSQAYKTAKQSFIDDLNAFKKLLEEAKATQPPSPEHFAPLLTHLNKIHTDFNTLRVYLLGFTATNAFNDEAQAESSTYGNLTSQFSNLYKQFTTWHATLDLDSVLAASDVAKNHKFYIQQGHISAQHLLANEAEDIISQLVPSTVQAWNKLHNDLISRSVIAAELPNREVADYPLTELRNLQGDADEATRKAAYEAELRLLQQNDVAFAASMNSIKGYVNSLSSKRGWDHALDEAIFNNSINHKSLAAMQEACQEHFPDFRRYMKAKASFLGKSQLAWYDLNAPVSIGEAKSYTWQESQDFVASNFRNYSDELADYAQSTFDNNWCDVPPRKGKRNGAFCVGVPGRKESRIMLNFGGTLDDIFTIAHELGHGYHNHCAYNDPNCSSLQRSATPMTLAETASIFCETIITNAMLEDASDSEKLAILEQDLLGANQLVVDIHSRFLFEKTVFDRRLERELSIDEFNEIMLDAQEQTYGDGLDPEYRNPYMWAHKAHYYSSSSFYNYPYTFGYLFGLGIYANYQNNPDGFHERYNTLLASTGKDNAMNLAKGFGIDIEDANFWRASLSIAKGRITEYEALVEKYRS